MSEGQKYAFQRTLRTAARKALERRGYQVSAVKGTGGARVDLERDGKKEWAFVRTSADRWIGWMRDEATGAFKGFDEGDAAFVVVAALDNEETPTRIEVFAFSPADVRASFHDNLAARKASNPALAHKAPIFVCLDPMDRGVPADTGSGLKEKAIWNIDLSIPAMASGDEPAAKPTPIEAADAKPSAAQAPKQETKEGFAARVRQEFAALMGVPVEKVRVEFHLSL